MSYTRVIPRDLFNEAKLLKCLGQFALIAHNGVDSARNAFPRCLTIEHDGEAFEIDQHEDSGDLYCRTFNVLVGRYGQQLNLACSYNNKRPYPLCASFEDQEEVSVFNDDGTLSAEFVKMAERLEFITCVGQRS